jgi:hypothetical protein
MSPDKRYRLISVQSDPLHYFMAVPLREPQRGIPPDTTAESIEHRFAEVRTFLWRAPGGQRQRVPSEGHPIPLVDCHPRQQVA